MRTLLFFLVSFFVLLLPMTTHTLTATLGGTVLELEVVSSLADKVRGLSGRAFLSEDQGMLFVYEQETRPAIWMKDMKFAIDIVWVSSGKKIIGTQENVSPDSYPARFVPEVPVAWVLEVKGGWIASHGVKVGDAFLF